MKLTRDAEQVMPSCDHLISPANSDILLQKNYYFIYYSVYFSFIVSSVRNFIINLLEF